MKKNQDLVQDGIMITFIQQTTVLLLLHVYPLIYELMATTQT